jgi:hypothetical protein
MHCHQRNEGRKVNAETRTAGTSAGDYSGSRARLGKKTTVPGRAGNLAAPIFGFHHLCGGNPLDFGAPYDLDVVDAMGAWPRGTEPRIAAAENSREAVVVLAPAGAPLALGSALFADEVAFPVALEGYFALPPTEPPDLAAPRFAPVAFVLAVDLLPAPDPE